MELVCPFVICLEMQIPLGQLQAKKLLSNPSIPLFGVRCVVLPWESLGLINTCTCTYMEIHVHSTLAL